MINPRFLKLSDINEKNFNKTSIERANTLTVDKLYETTKHIAYAVRDLFKGSEHVVIYKSEKKPPLDWTCDCKWYTARTVHSGKYCAHILAVQLKRKK
jgi:hypothetical protein